MPKFHVSYALQGNAGRRYITINTENDTTVFPDVAFAIIKHEFPNVCAPFGLVRQLPAELVLLNFGIVDVVAPLLMKDHKHDELNQ